MTGDRPLTAQNLLHLNGITVTDCTEPSEHSTNIFKIEHRVTPFPFLKIPSELRRQIYYDYLEAQYTAQDELIYETSFFEEPQGLPLLQVNRQIRLELKQFLLCDKVIRYLRIFCEELQEFAAKVKHLLVVFMESGRDQALSADDRKEPDRSWSKPEHSGLPKRTLEKYEHLYFDKTNLWNERWTDEYDSTDDEANSDIKYILDQFALVTNVKDVCIELPHSLRNNIRLQEMVQTTEDIMSMRRLPTNPDKNRRGMMEMFSECKQSLKLETGRNSKQRLKELDTRLGGLSERVVHDTGNKSIGRVGTISYIHCGLVPLAKIRRTFRSTDIGIYVAT
ncbi:MAG: hypothetical protein Q9214_006707 [Letrouitia sp. 1 TL-2023]